MEKFTKGPWKQPKETLDERSLFIGDKTGNFDIAVISFDHSPSIGEARANAALIAAAPDMFEALKETERKLREGLYIASPWGAVLHDKITAALAKATL